MQQRAAHPATTQADAADAIAFYIISPLEIRGGDAVFIVNHPCESRAQQCAIFFDQMLVWNAQLVVLYHCATRTRFRGLLIYPGSQQGLFIKSSTSPKKDIRYEYNIALFGQFVGIGSLSIVSFTERPNNSRRTARTVCYFLFAIKLESTVIVQPDDGR